MDEVMVFLPATPKARQQIHNGTKVQFLFLSTHDAASPQVGLEQSLNLWPTRVAKHMVDDLQI